MGIFGLYGSVSTSLMKVDREVARKWRSAGLRAACSALEDSQSRGEGGRMDASGGECLLGIVGCSVHLGVPPKDSVNREQPWNFK